jgi:hypothetical protein
MIKLETYYINTNLIEFMTATRETISKDRPPYWFFIWLTTGKRFQVYIDSVREAEIEIMNIMNSDKHLVEINDCVMC